MHFSWFWHLSSFHFVIFPCLATLSFGCDYAYKSLLKRTEIYETISWKLRRYDKNIKSIEAANLMCVCSKLTLSHTKWMKLTQIRHSLTLFRGVKETLDVRTKYHDLISRNWEEIPFSLRIVPRGLSVAEGPKTVIQNAAHLYSDQANPLF